jgi:hypothetical protein
MLTTVLVSIFSPVLLCLSGPAEEPEPAEPKPAEEPEASPTEAADAKAEEPEVPPADAPEAKAEESPAPVKEEEAGASTVETSAEAEATVPAVDTAQTTAADRAPEPPAEEAAAGEEKPAGPTFVLGVEAWLRGQGKINPDFDSSEDTAEDYGEVLERARLQARATWGPVAVFAQVQDARTWGIESSTASNEANTDLHQGYFELFGAKEEKKLSGYIRVGRQEIIYGKQRMIGGLNWAPTARSFDALRLHGQAGMVDLDMFGAIMQPMGTVSQAAPTPTDPDARDSTWSHGSQVAGVQLGIRPHKAFNAEVLNLFVREDRKEDDIDFDRRIGDVGAHLFGEPLNGLTYDGEAHYQYGKFFNTLDHAAWAWALQVGYMYKKPRVKPGLHVGYAMASGHGCTGDPGADPPEACGNDKDESFFNFYPTNHMHYGHIDLQNWSNMRDLEAALKLAYDKLLNASVTYHWLQLQEPTGAWTNAGGGLVGAGWDPANEENTLGHEIDVAVKLTPWKPMMLMPGYAVFIPAGAGKTLGGDDPQHFPYLWIIVKLEGPVGGGK